ncbi:MAG: protein kinase [Myxococcota bacterium]|nr:protein kinase [Myxococcota bacterium]
MTSEKYQIVQKLDTGGMAEVWKGKATSLQGFEKLVAIKRVLPELAEKDEFLSMFLDEARLALGLNHANIVQTFDIGLSGDAYFIVMEWIDGLNLRAILEALKEKKRQLSVAETVFIVAEVCRGLSYAHNCMNSQGEPLYIVHRDINPPNVLISREGEVKLVDFGLAKASTQASPTAQGMIKGKFGYLSPEAAFGEEIDARADLFAVGVLLWEMLAGRRLFDGANNRETVLMVRAAEHPPLASINPAVDDELEEIVSRSLERDRERRYQSAEELGRALTRYLFQRQLFVDSFAISKLIQELKPETGRHMNAGEGSQLDLVEAELISFTSIEQLDPQDRSPIQQLRSAVPEIPRSVRGPQTMELSSLSVEDVPPAPANPLRREHSPQAPVLPAQQTIPRLSIQPEPVPPERSPMPQRANTARFEIPIIDPAPSPEVEPEPLPESAFGAGLTVPPTELPQRSHFQATVTSARYHPMEEKKGGGWLIALIAVLLLGAGTYVGLFLL